jgi:hypothetical protein
LPAFLGVLGTGQGVGALAGGMTAATLIKHRGEPPVLGLGLLATAGGCALMTTGALTPVMVGVLPFAAGLTVASLVRGWPRPLRFSTAGFATWRLTGTCSGTKDRAQGVH